MQRRGFSFLMTARSSLKASGTAEPFKDQTTIKLTWNADGWWTSQLTEHPAAISQGRTPDEAVANVRAALIDLLFDLLESEP